MLYIIHQRADGTLCGTGIGAVPDADEPADAFAARMVAAIVPAGAQHLVTTPQSLPPGVPLERLSVDWGTGAISVITAPPPSLQAYAAAIQSHIDATAHARGYLDGVTCASYVASTNSTWAAQATAYVAWRDAVWAAAYQTLASVQSGQSQPPTIAALIAGLPAMTWP